MGVRLRRFVNAFVRIELRPGASWHNHWRLLAVREKRWGWEAPRTRSRDGCAT